MPNSKFVQANEKIADAIVGGYKKIEHGVVGGYEAIGCFNANETHHVREYI